MPFMHEPFDVKEGQYLFFSGHTFEENAGAALCLDLRCSFLRAVSD